MASEERERVQVSQGEGFEHRRRIVESAPSTQQVLVSRISKLIWLFASVINGLILLRFVLKLIAANPNNAFAAFIYRVTDVLVAPFVGLTGTPTFDTGAIIDVAAIFAIVIYLLVAWVIVRLFRIVFSDVNRARRETTYVRKE